MYKRLFVLALFLKMKASGELLPRVGVGSVPSILFLFSFYWVLVVTSFVEITKCMYVSMHVYVYKI